MIDEILYNSDYALRHLLGDNQIFDENLKKASPRFRYDPTSF